MNFLQKIYLAVVIVVVIPLWLLAMLSAVIFLTL
mgnify:CR=1 FL=1